MKRYSTLYVIIEIQIRIIIQYHYKPIRMPQIWNIVNNKFCGAGGCSKFSYIASENTNWYRHFGRQFAGFL